MWPDHVVVFRLHFSPFHYPRVHCLVAVDKETHYSSSSPTFPTSPRTFETKEKINQKTTTLSYHRICIIPSVFLSYLTYIPTVSFRNRTDWSWPALSELLMVAASTSIILVRPPFFFPLTSINKSQSETYMHWRAGAPRNPSVLPIRTVGPSPPFIIDPRIRGRPTDWERGRESERPRGMGNLLSQRPPCDDVDRR